MEQHTEPGVEAGDRMKWRILFALSIAELLGMTLWFSATAVTPALAVEWQLSEGDRAWLTMSVQVLWSGLCSARC